MLKSASAMHFFLAVLLLGAGLPAAAAEAPGAEEESPWILGLALGHGRQLNPFVDSEDIDLNLVLDIAWFGERFFFDNGDLGVTLSESASFSTNAVLTFNNERNYYNYLRNSSGGLGLSALTEGPRLAGEDMQEGERERGDGLEAAGATDLGIFPGRVDSSLPKRDFAISSGLEVLRISRWGDLQAQVLTDVSGTHGGQEAWFAWSYPWFTPAQEFTLSLGLEWKSRELVDYYYGVAPDEVLPGRPEYRGRSAVNPYLRFSASHSINDRWKLVSVLERKFLDDGIQNSPIIERDTVDTFFIGLYYRF